MKFSLIIILASLVCGCIKQHKNTAILCNKNLYVETFAVFPFGLRNDYLTDSLSFRKNIGRWDSEHEYFLYKCVENKIIILKVRTGQNNCHWVISIDGKKTIECTADTIEKNVFFLKK